MSPILSLILAIASEIIATTSLKLSEGFSKPLPSIVVVLGYGAAFYLLSQSLKAIPLGTTYAIWSGVGTAGAVLLGVIIWREPVDLARIIGIGLIVAGVVVLNLFAEGAVSA
jgi:small multidrug resistance pump